MWHQLELQRMHGEMIRRDSAWRSHRGLHIDHHMAPAVQAGFNAAQLAHSMLPAGARAASNHSTALQPPKLVAETAAELQVCMAGRDY